MRRAISPEGLALIREFEGFRAQPAPTPDGHWVVGYGHVRVGDAGTGVNQNEAAALLAQDTAPYENVVNDNVTVALTQVQFDALVSFAFSIGADAFLRSQVLRRINACEFVAAACAMDAWRAVERNDELVRRRAVERALLLNDLPPAGAASAILRPKLDHAAAILGAPTNFVALPAPGRRLTEILRAEPATALLLTEAQLAPSIETPEIATAHARPVARGRGADWLQVVAPRAMLSTGLGLCAGAALVLAAGDRAGALVLALPGAIAVAAAGYALSRSAVGLAAR